MWKHSCEKRGNSVPDFVMNVTGIFHDDAMLRQITEAVLISKVQRGELMNYKSELNYASIPRVVVAV